MCGGEAEEEDVPVYEGVPEGLRRAACLAAEARGRRFRSGGVAGPPTLAPCRAAASLGRASATPAAGITAAAAERGQRAVASSPGGPPSAAGRPAPPQASAAARPTRREHEAGAVRARFGEESLDQPRGRAPAEETARDEKEDGRRRAGARTIAHHRPCEGARVGERHWAVAAEVAVSLHRGDACKVLPPAVGGDAACLRRLPP